MVLSRRQLLQASVVGSGAFSLAMQLPALGQAMHAEDNRTPLALWVEIGRDDSVLIRFARSELGQGSMTAAPQLVAEELDADWNQVKVDYVDTNLHMRMNRAWGDMATSGSRTIRSSQAYLRQAGATARAMLVAAAARQWDVPVTEITVNNGIISHAASSRTTGFGAVAQVAAGLPVPETVSLKDPALWTIVGQSVPRIDIPPSVDGSQVYGADVVLPGMVYAAIAQSPVFGGKLRAFDASAVLQRRGIIKVFSIDEDRILAVVADNWWRAKEALQAIEIQWDEGENAEVSSASILAYFREGLDSVDAAVLPNSKGDVAQAFREAEQVLEGEFFTPYLSHAPLEPLGATVRINGDRIDVWASTQAADATHMNVANALQVPAEQVYLHRVQTGGGFGRRGSADDFSRPAALIARALPDNTPVKLLWTREEDIQHDFYRPMAMYRLKAAIDKSGKVSAWQTRVASGSIMNQLLKAELRNGIDGAATEGFADFPYAVPNQHHDYVQRRTHVPIGFWRTVGWSQTPFAREQFIDEIAHTLKQDPYHYRRSLLTDEPLPLDILDKVAAAASWDTPLPAGVFRGIATTEPYGSYTSAVVELSVSDAGLIHIHRIVQAINTGYVVHPDNIVAQIQGAVVWALTAAMWSEITFSKGRVEQSNFNNYRMLKIGEMPPVEVVLAPSGGFWGGVGEPGQAPIIPALCNAIFAATGKRVRSLPLRNEGFQLA